MEDQSRRRARFRPDDPSHFNYGKLGWAYPPGTYDPESGADEGPEWILEPDDVDANANFAPVEDLDFDVDVDTPAT